MKNLVFSLIVITGLGLRAEEAEVAPSEQHSFYRQSLISCWGLRAHLAQTEKPELKEFQLKRMTEMAFSYWVYLENRQIIKDKNFEDLISIAFFEEKFIPTSYLDDPLPQKKGAEGDRPGHSRLIIGFKWTPDEYAKLIPKFKKFVNEIRVNDLPE
jgi:hypothetical protein